MKRTILFGGLVLGCALAHAQAGIARAGGAPAAQPAPAAGTGAMAQPQQAPLQPLPAPVLAQPRPPVPAESVRRPECVTKPRRAADWMRFM